MLKIRNDVLSYSRNVMSSGFTLMVIDAVCLNIRSCCRHHHPVISGWRRTGGFMTTQPYMKTSVNPNEASALYLKYRQIPSGKEVM